MTGQHMNTEKQLKLEQESIEWGERRYHSTEALPWQDAPSNAGSGEEADTAPGRELVRRAVEPMAAAYREFLAHARQGKAGRRHAALPYLEMFEPEVACFHAARVALNKAGDETSLQSSLQAIGGVLNDHWMMAEFAKQDPGLLKHTEKKLAKSTSGRHRKNVLKHAMKLTSVKGLEWTMDDIQRVGEKLLDFFISTSGLVEVRTIRTGRKTNTKLYLTEKCMEWLEKAHGQCALLNPVNMPMVLPPLEWTTPFDGGYLTKTLRNSLVRVRNTAYLDELYNWNMPKVYSSVNAIQATRWKINGEVLEVLNKAFTSNSTIAGMPSRVSIPLPAKPYDIDTNEDALKEWKKKAVVVYSTNESLRSKRLKIMQQMWIANKFSEEAEIFFPHNLDFRGRIYPIPALVNPQADDLGKSLITFAGGKRLGETGGYWLAVHIANLWGKDKLPLDERVQWTVDNTEAIIDSANRPLEGQMFWCKADNPWCALAASFEWRGATQYGDDWISRIPIAQDGSCSGLQHYSALLKDPEGAAAVNLTASDQPSDIYTTVANLVEAKLSIMRPAKQEDQDLVNAWKGRVIRKIAKQPCMTFAYSATQYGMSEQIKAALKKLDEDHEKYLPEGVDNYKAAKFLSGVVYEAICETVKSASGGMSWFQQFAALYSSDGVPIRWVSPIGLPIVQDYKKKKGRRIDTYINGVRYQLRFNTETSVLDSRAMRNGIAPNIIHGLDASHLMDTVNKCVSFGIDSYAMIHDSFAVHAADSQHLAEALRGSFIDMYSKDLIQDFIDQASEQLKDAETRIPEPPASGSFNLTDIWESEFFFS